MEILTPDMANPGGFCIDIGERAGSGIPNIFRVWREQGWVMPAITEQLESERTILSLAFEKTSDKNKQ